MGLRRIFVNTKLLSSLCLGKGDLNRLQFYIKLAGQQKDAK